MSVSLLFAREFADYQVEAQEAYIWLYEWQIDGVGCICRPSTVVRAMNGPETDK